MGSFVTVAVAVAVIFSCLALQADARVLTELFVADLKSFAWSFKQLSFLGSKVASGDGGGVSAVPVPTESGALNSPVVMAMAPAPGPSIGPSPPPPFGCPPTADMCAFSFEGSIGSIPTFKLTGHSPDSPISPMIVTRDENIKVLSANSQFADYVCSDNGFPPDNQFYVTNTAVQFRTFNTKPMSAYSGLYVRLNLTLAIIDGYNHVTNLNPGDESTLFPIERRCVLFKVQV